MNEVNVNWVAREKQIREVADALPFTGLQAGRLARFARELLEASEAQQARKVAEDAYALATSSEAIVEGMLGEAETAFHTLADVYAELGLENEVQDIQEKWQLSFFMEPPVRIVA
jgi:hypothetical protein